MNADLPWGLTFSSNSQLFGSNGIRITRFQILLGDKVSLHSIKTLKLVCWLQNRCALSRSIKTKSRCNFVSVGTEFIETSTLYDKETPSKTKQYYFRYIFKSCGLKIKTSLSFSFSQTKWLDIGKSLATEARNYTATRTDDTIGEQYPHGT